ncbi:MAG: ABC-F family ATP-binding cassette domain-containing protein [Leptospiraceae bacterium]|nr:ABC-F family ATP-binding cassette domain-containing protein [Leptospiraceae bacterium]MCK6381821.1 ABC-F family ATP-binding cassette domain-containing protein [Leptospiraceae bacterium]NUM40961.1 ABC-F family ATP-binding cassette domain-containing protein [Leptospiraceae bacterium]
MLQFISISHQYASNILFEDFSWHIKPNQKIALVGPNGAGKTTLFQMAIGKISPDSGEVIRPKNTAISLFQQIPEFDSNRTVLETALEENILYKEYSAKKKQIDSRFETIDLDSKEFEILLHDQSELEDFANSHRLHELEVSAKKILSGLGYKDEFFEKKIGDFSPGFKHRLALAIALLNPHNLLLLDEPTNHLDDASKEWLSEYLKSIRIAFVLVTHDPDFLNRTTNTIVEISKKGVTEFTGTLDEFLEEKNEIHAKLKEQFKKEESYLKKRSEWIERFRSKATKARQVQSAIKKLDKREKVENPEELFWNKKPDYNFRFTPDGKISFRLEDGSFRYSENSKPIFQNASMEVSSGEKIALVGPNGAGKSTLLRALGKKSKLSSGSIYYGPKTSIGYFSQTHGEELNSELNMLESVQKKFPEISEESIRDILGHFAFSDDLVFKKVKSMSGGEQSRLRLALMVLSPSNCLLLDEPTNHLDMVTRDALKRALADFPGSVLIISHDPDFLKGLCSRTFELIGGELKNLNCSFDDYLKFHKEGVYEEPKNYNPKPDKPKSQDKNRIKKIQKEISELEGKISLLEKNKVRLEELLADPGFYKNRSYQTELDNYSEVKKNLNSHSAKWEALSEELENLQEKRP